MEDMVIKTPFECPRDRWTIRGFKYARQGGNRPIVIISHGFGGNCTSTQHYAAAYAEDGYACYVFDFVGGGVESKSDGKMADMTVFTEAEDLKAVIAYARADAGTDGSRVILIGCSQGGFVSGITAAQIPDQIEKVVMYYPALCIPDDARRGQMLMFQFDPRHIPEKIGTDPLVLGYDYPASVMDKVTEDLICPYTGPILIVHGTLDRVVDIRYARRFREAIPNCTLVEVQNADHGFTRDVDEGFVMPCTRLFLEKPYEELLAVDVRLTGHEARQENGVTYVALPFDGTASGRDFNGTILPGACDHQEHTETTHKLCATYTIQGTDCSGAAGTVRVRNSGDAGLLWHPEIHTDCPALQHWNAGEHYAILQHRKQGPMVHIFQVLPVK